MPKRTRRFRVLVVALAAIAAGVSAPGQAWACSAWANAERACDTACGCCAPAGDEVPASGVALRTTPVEDCGCRVQAPASPAPKPSRLAPETRPEPAGAADLPLPGTAIPAARPAATSQVPLTQSPPEAPLYLRNERLRF